MREKQKKISVSFKDNERELKLYNWLQAKGEIVGCSGIIKEILIKVMEQEDNK